MRLAEKEENINATIIALDAQKAFDSVSHNYITQVLQRIGLTQMVPIFKLLYKDLDNDIIINGRIGKGYQLRNGVKQGDALSCSLFILAIEPMIRNIAKNDTIRNVQSARLNFNWPKLVAYADDITVLTHNEPRSVNAVFAEYYRLTKASGLTLNADKTEKFDVYSRNILRPLRQLMVSYGAQQYNLVSQDSIKLNGIIFQKDKAAMQQLNFELMYNKMTNNFKDWGRRSLSLLGKIQIIKTFGLSQYLYALAVTDIGEEHWKSIHKEIHKFLWNKHYSVQANAAPHRLKKVITYTEVKNGGFGMVRLDQIMMAARLKRFSYLLTQKNHPMAALQVALGADRHLCKRAKLEIDDVTDGVLKMLNEHLLYAYNLMPDENVATDLLMHRLLLGSHIKDAVMEVRRNSIEMTTLRRRGIQTVGEAVRGGIDNMRLLRRIACVQLRRQLAHLQFAYRFFAIPDPENEIYVYNMTMAHWHRTATLTSRQIRKLVWEEQCIVDTKLMRLDADTAPMLYGKITKLRNIQNKSKLLRLLHGEVYSGNRLFRYGLAETDRCIRCFAEETIKHLLYECPYSAEVWGRLGMVPGSVAEIINARMSGTELEVRAEFISHLVFRKSILPPEVLVRTIINNFNTGLSRNKKTRDYAKALVENYELTGQWFTY